MKKYPPYKSYFKQISCTRLYTLFLCFLSINTFSQENKQLILVEKDKLKVQAHIQFGMNGVAETNLFWNLADVPTLDFDSDPEWLESYLKPGISFKIMKGTKSTFFGKISGVGSYTLGVDAFDARNTGRVTLEEAYLGYRLILSDNTQMVVSLGSQELKLGTGMLISNGASSGFERGALKFGPRKAWQRSLFAELNFKKLQNRLFYIEPNELPSNNTDNQLAGVDLNYMVAADKFIGFSYIKVLQSMAPYPKAALDGEGPPVITPGDRKGLNAINLYTKTRPFKDKMSQLFVALDLAYQWNERINMKAWGGRTQIGYDLNEIIWRPTVMYTYQVFSGDDPATVGQERFDPLYFEGNPSAWSTGSKSSMVFINSNVQSHGLSLRLILPKKNILTLRYAHISAQQLLSPIQFGQATRVEFSEDIPTVISGVTNRKLADDFFLEYNRIINQNIYFNAGFSISFPGKGIRSIVGNTSNWTGGFVNIVFNY